MRQTARHILLVLVQISSAFASNEFIETGNEIFDRIDLSLKGRLRHMTVENVLEGPGMEVITTERDGAYPKWTSRISVWPMKPKGKTAEKAIDLLLPAETIFFGFLPIEGEKNAHLIIVKANAIEVWRPIEKGWEKDPKRVAAINTIFYPPEVAEAVPFDPRVPGTNKILVPEKEVWSVYSVSADKLSKDKSYPMAPRNFVRTANENYPFDLPFWLKSTAWFPALQTGSLSGQNPIELFFLPWMDEVQMLNIDGPTKSETHYFNQLSENERDDGQSYIVTNPIDLNGDGRMDFLVNKFQGVAASLRAETTVYLTDKDGKIPAKGLFVKPQGNRAGGAIALDVNRDGKQDLVEASANFSVWNVVRALLKRQAEVQFSFYINHPNGFALSKPDFVREILFHFDLSDLMIDGLLPSLDGDFNGDGFPDAFYARDRKAVTVLLQKPKSKELFPSVPSGMYDITVPRLFKIGDFNGDGRSDVVLYDRRPPANKKVTVLLNSRRL